MRSLLSVLAVLVGVGLAACPDFVPGEDTRISCTGKTSCPDKWHCNADIERCIPDDVADHAAPTIENASAAPSPAGPEGDVVIAFDVSEALFRDPVVHVGDALAVLDPSATDRAQLHFAFDYAVTGDEIAAGTNDDVAITADLVDALGNAGPATPVTALALDFAPPAVTGLAVELPVGQSALGPDDDLQFHASTEAGAVVVAANVVDGTGAVVAAFPATSVTVTADANGATATIRGDIALGPLSLSDGDTVLVDLVVADAVGNQTSAGAVRSAAVTIDATAPTGTLAFVPAQPITASLDVTVHAASPDASSVCFRGDIVPVVTCDADVDFVALSAGAGDFSLTLSPSEGGKIIEAIFRDAAFNASAAVDASIAYLPSGVLRAAPAIVLPGAQTALKDGDAVIISGTAQIGAVVQSAALVDLDAGGAVLQSIPAATVGLSAGGVLSGTFITNALPDGHSVGLEVVVAIGALASDPANSRSQPVIVDDTPPQGVDVVVQEGPVVQITSVHLALTATGATTVFIDGALDNAVDVRADVPFQNVLAVPLSIVDGDHEIDVTFKDGANNTAFKSVHVVLNRSQPGVTPSITSPLGVGVPGVKANDVVTVGGDADPDVTRISSATLRYRDASHAPLAGTGCFISVTGQLSLGAPTPRIPLVGTINVGACTGAAEVVLEVIVATQAGVLSDAAASTSSALFVDVAPPSSTSATLVADASLHAQAGFTRSRTVTLNVSATDAHGPVTMIVTGDVVGLPSTAIALPAGGSQLVDLSDVEGSRAVTVVFLDAVGNASAPKNATITLDKTAPQKPLATTLRLAESNPAANDPTKVAAVNDHLFVTGVGNTIVNGSRAFAYADAGLTQRITFPLGASPGTLDLPANAQSGFDTQEIPNDGSHAVFIVAVDEAGNESVATQVAVPVFTFGAVDSPHRQIPLAVPFTSSLPLANGPNVVVGGHANASSCSGGPTSFTCTFTPDGSEAQGVNRAVVRVSGDAAGFAAQTTGTSARVMTLDFTPPVIDAQKLVLVQSDPGAQDQLAALAGAVTDHAGADDVTATSAITARVFTAAGGAGTAFPAAAPAAVAPDGAIAPAFDVGDNAADPLFLRVTDAAGNPSEVQLVNDRAGPVLVGLLAAPPAQRSGAAMSITFTAGDPGNVHDLRADPVVTVGGRAATKVSGVTTTSTGAQPFTYTFTPQAGTDAEGTRALSVVAVDAVGNASAPTSINVVLDFTIPTAADALPGTRPSGTWNGLPAISGTANDTAPGSVALAEIAVKDTTTSLWLTAANTFSSPVKVFLAASGTAAWTQATAPPYVDGDGYQLRFRSTDAAGNVSVEGGPLSWTQDVSPPDTTITSANPGSITATNATFTFTSSEAGSTFECALDGAAFGACTTSHTVSGLALGDHAFAVRAIDGAGNTDPSPASQTFHVARVFVDASAVNNGDRVAAVAQDGTLWMWGELDQPGGIPLAAGITASALPVQVGTDRDWATVSTGALGTCAIKQNDQSLWCWGFAPVVPLGGASPVTPQRVPTALRRWVGVSQGLNNGCAIDTVAELFCWGDNAHFQLADGSNTASVDIEQVGLDTDWAQVSVGSGTVCATKDNGALLCWGQNDAGQTGAAEDPTTDPTPVDANLDWNEVNLGPETACGLRNGSAFCWGSNTSGQAGQDPATLSSTTTPVAVDAATTWTDLAAGDRHSCGVRANQLVCFGVGASGEIGDPASSDDVVVPPRAVSIPGAAVRAFVGADATYALEVGGPIASLGRNRKDQLGTGLEGRKRVPTDVATGVARVSVGQPVTCILDAAGAVSCAGEDFNAQLGDAPASVNRSSFTALAGALPAFDRITVGPDVVLARRASDQHVFGWGLNETDLGLNGSNGAPVAPTEILGGIAFADVSANGGGVVAAAADGRLFEWGRVTPFVDVAQPTQIVPGQTDWISVSAGDDHDCAIEATGVLSCWGANNLGQCGLNSTVSPKPPAPVVGGHTWSQVSAGGSSTCAVTAESGNVGALLCWGSDGNGQLGVSSSDFSNRVAPTLVLEPGPWRRVAEMGTHTCAVKLDGTLWCWGSSANGNLGNGTDNASSTVPIRVGTESSWVDVTGASFGAVCALRGDASMACFGGNESGEVGDGSGFTSVAAEVPQP